MKLDNVISYKKSKIKKQQTYKKKTKKHKQKQTQSTKQPQKTQTQQQRWTTIASKMANSGTSLDIASCKGL